MEWLGRVVVIYVASTRRGSEDRCQEMVGGPSPCTEMDSYRCFSSSRGHHEAHLFPSERFPDRAL